MEKPALTATAHAISGKFPEVLEVEGGPACHAGMMLGMEMMLQEPEFCKALVKAADAETLQDIGRSQPEIAQAVLAEIMQRWEHPL